MRVTQIISVFLSIFFTMNASAQTIVSYPADMNLDLLIKLLEIKTGHSNKEDSFNIKFVLAELYALRAINSGQKNIIIEDITEFVPQNKLTEENEQELFEAFRKSKDFTLSYKDIKPSSFLESKVANNINKSYLLKSKKMFLNAKSDLNSRIKKLKSDQEECDKIKNAKKVAKTECKIKEEALAKDNIAQADFCQAQNMIEMRLLRISELSGEKLNFKNEYLSLLKKLEFQSEERIKLSSAPDYKARASCIGVASGDDALEGLNYTNFERQNIRDVSLLLKPHLVNDKKELKRVEELKEKTKHDDFRVQQIADEILN